MELRRYAPEDAAVVWRLRLDHERAEVKRIRVDLAYRRRGLGEAILRRLLYERDLD